MQNSLNNTAPLSLYGLISIPFVILMDKKINIQEIRLYAFLRMQENYPEEFVFSFKDYMKMMDVKKKELEKSLGILEAGGYISKTSKVGHPAHSNCDNNWIINTNTTGLYMEHAFNVNVAKQFSVNVAIFLQHMKFWTFHNLANKRHIHDGLCWTYNTLEAFSIIFPFWSKQNLETVIRHCIEHGLIVKGNYNQTKYDRTNWYAMTLAAYEYYDELLDDSFMETLKGNITDNQEIDFLKPRNGSLRTKRPIPDTNPDTKPINNPLNPPSVVSRKKPVGISRNELIQENPHALKEELIDEWLVYRKKPVTKRVWNKINEVLATLEKKGIKPHKAFERMLEKQWQSIELNYFEDWLNESKKPIDNQDENYSLGDRNEFGF